MNDAISNNYTLELNVHYVCKSCGRKQDKSAPEIKFWKNVTGFGFICVGCVANIRMSDKKGNSPLMLSDNIH